MNAINTLISKSFNEALSILLFFFTFGQVNAQTAYEQMPFSTNSHQFTVWNGEQYVPFFIKGVNLGVSKPGTFPGELIASEEDYMRWFQLIQDAGFNNIRLYTLHYPRFYKSLKAFNEANPNQPIYFFQGIWLEEEIIGYDEDLFSLSADFTQEMEHVIGAVHGDAEVGQKPGKAWGTFNQDVSKYLVGYIVGREIYPAEVWHTNQVHADMSYYEGRYLSIRNTLPTEAWMTGLLDKVLQYETDQFQMMHPVSFSSWPTLDPISHPEETNRDEDSVTIDLSGIDRSLAPAGYFASYHAYPYYPDFVSRQPSYQDATDYIGQNSYFGYLKDLQSHYKNIPLLIAEFGTSSSWGVAHYSQNGIHHGGADEVKQGKDYLRMFKNFESLGLAGGIQFAWIDEWFKRTWITDPLDQIADRRILWQNLTAAEQNFGLLGYRLPNSIPKPWEEICNSCVMQKVEASADYSFYRLKLYLSEEFNASDTLWLALDTYENSLGETILPNGKSISHRAEFAIMLNQGEANLFVTQAYDLYGIWHQTSGPEQLYQSTATNGAPWKLVRWKNNNTLNEVQYIGRLGVNRLNLPLKSTDAVIIKDRSIEFRIPWNLLQFTDPSEKTVMHDNRATPEIETATSDGIAVDLQYKGQSFSSVTRFSWENWQFPSSVEEYQKGSYLVIKEGLENISSAPIAHSDYYELDVDDFEILEENGLIMNDIVFSHYTPEVYLTGSPKNGLLQLNIDGSFTYQPISSFAGIDTFKYQLRSGSQNSVPVKVTLKVPEQESTASFVRLYPNPASRIANFESSVAIQLLEVFNAKGQQMQHKQMNGLKGEIDISSYQPGVYFVRFTAGKQTIVNRIIKN